MAKLRNSFTSLTARKPPVVASDSASSVSARVALPRDLASKSQNIASEGSISQGRNFGQLHTKATGSSVTSGSQWMSLLNTASSGATSVLGGGLLSVGGFGFIGQLLNLFGGGKATPVAPTAFQSPLPQQNSLNVTLPGAANPVSLGVHALNATGANVGAYQQSGAAIADHASQSAQVVQIVKQALLTSSSLNDVISEI